MHVRCPHCNNPTEFDSNSIQDDILCASCGSSFNLIDTEETVTYVSQSHDSISHFDLLERIGFGAHGEVWRARDTSLDRIVAVKFPRNSELHEEEIERFFREARATAQLQHPNIVAVHEVGHEGGKLFIVSDYIAGVTLNEWLSEQRMSSREAAELCVHVAEALQHAHDAGVVHRDLKPNNIMIDGDMKPYVMDFGLAKRDAGEATLTIDGQILGTPAYMSPELASGEGHSADGRSDVYSLGVILYELLTGSRPFRGTIRMLLFQVLNEDPQPPRSLNDRIPRDLEAICLKAMEKEPERRYSNANQMIDDLHRFINGQPVAARPSGRLAKLWKWCQNPDRIHDASLLCLFLGVVLATWSFIGIITLSLGLYLPSQWRDLEQRIDSHSAVVEMIPANILFMAIIWIGWEMRNMKLYGIWAGWLLSLSCAVLDVLWFSGIVKIEHGGYYENPATSPLAMLLFLLAVPMVFLSFAAVVAYHANPNVVRWHTESQSVYRPK